MSRLVLVVAASVLGLGALFVAWLLLLPPEPRTERIERPVPIDRGATQAPAPAPAPAAPAAPAGQPPRR